MKKYQKFAAFFAFFATLSLLLYFSLIYIQIGYPTESSRWIYECVEMKKNIAQKIDERKLLIISGSGGFWGISAQQIENATGMKTVNMAVHAGLGIEYILEYSTPTLKSGDVALLALEHFSSTSGNKIGEVAIDYIFSREPRYFWGRNIFEKIEIFCEISPSRLFDGLTAMVRIPKEKLDGYQSETTDAWGDQTNNKSADMTDTQRKRVVKLPATDALTTPLDENIKVWDVLEKFLAEAKKRGVLVLATYPNILYNPAYEEKQALKNIEVRENFFRSKGVPILGSAQEFMYPPEFFHDTTYHLNDVGTKIRTEKLIEYLMPCLK